MVSISQFISPFNKPLDLTCAGPVVGQIGAATIWLDVWQIARFANLCC
jgi:hypothetical protein